MDASSSCNPWKNSTTMPDSEERDSEDDVPLQYRRPFGTGLKRKKIEFVRATSPEPSVATTTAQSKTLTSIDDLYLGVVMRRDNDVSVDTNSTSNHSQGQSIPSPMTTTTFQAATICNVCSMPFAESLATNSIELTAKEAHETSIAHQVCLKHSHPPSAVDRNRMGLAVLQSRGWDPDSRQGLGAAGQGLQFPLKAKDKQDKMGLGLVVPPEVAASARARAEKKKMKNGGSEVLGAAECRKLEASKKRKADRLGREFYGNEDLDRYLGGSQEPWE